MESLFKKLRNFVGEDVAVDDYDEEYDDDEYDTEPLKVVSRQNQKRKTQSASNLVSMPSPSASKLVVYRPQRFDDMEYVVDSLRSKKSVVVIFDGLSIKLVQRMLDFTAGTVCALGCTSSMVSDTVCVIVPNNMELIDSREIGN